MRFRKATKEDLPTIISMIADDPLGATREQFEDPLPTFYLDAFEKIKNNENVELTVVTDSDNIIGTFHLSFLQYLTYKGGIRAQLEAVRVHKDHRGKGIGKKILEYVIQRSMDKGCHMIQLTSDKKRPQAIEFYKSFGFVNSHEGFKLHLINH